MSDAVVPGPGGMTWTIGECGCGRTTWSVRGGDGLGVLMVAECGCGERRELRLSTGPSVATGPLEIKCTYDAVVPSPAQHARDLADFEAFEVVRQKGAALADAAREEMLAQPSEREHQRRMQAERDAYPGILVPVYRLDDERIDIVPKEPGQRPIGCTHGIPAAGAAVHVTLNSGGVWLMRMAGAAAEAGDPVLSERINSGRIAGAPPSAKAQVERDSAALDPRCPTKTVAEVAAEREFSDPTDYFRKQKARRLSKLAEAQAIAKTRPTAKLLRAAECHSNPLVRDIARAELLSRAAEAARPPDIRDEWDNLEDAEPEGIVPRGAK